MKTCPYCAEEIQDAAIVCKHCGRALTPDAPPLVVTPAPAQKSSSWFPLLLLVLGIGVVAIAVMNWISPAPSSEATGNSAQRLYDGSVDQRQNLLKTAIAGAGYLCPEVDKSTRQSTDRDGDLWNAHCYQGDSYAVLVHTDGSTRVMPCRNAVGVTCGAGY